MIKRKNGDKHYLYIFFNKSFKHYIIFFKIFSLGALGAMHYFGLGCRKDHEAAYECLTDSSERGSVFSMGLLCHYYYKNKFYCKAYDLAKKFVDLLIN